MAKPEANHNWTSLMREIEQAIQKYEKAEPRSQVVGLMIQRSGNALRVEPLVLPASAGRKLRMLAGKVELP